MFIHKSFYITIMLKVYYTIFIKNNINDLAPASLLAVAILVKSFVVPLAYYVNYYYVYPFRKAFSSARLFKRTLFML